jgi:hypothetical protein
MNESQRELGSALDSPQKHKPLGASMVSPVAQSPCIGPILIEGGP